MDELNQVQDTVIEEEGLFDDLVAEDTPIEETEEVEEAPKVEEKKETEPQSTEPFLKIKYNKEELGLTQDEARELAQKGKNYDNIYGKYNAMNDRLSKLARMNNLDVDSYFASLEETQMRFETDKEIKQLLTQYPNADTNLLKEIAETRVKERLQLAEQKANEQQQSESNTQRAEIERQVALFNKHYPNLEADKLDAKVYELMESGYTLLEAYSTWKSEKEAEMKATQTAQEKVAKKNEENRHRGYGSLGSTGTSEEDSFLEGFLKY